MSSHPVPCTVCGKTFSRHEVVPGATIRPEIVERIVADHPGWTPDGLVCRADLNRYREAYVHGLVEAERGEISSLEAEVLRSLEAHELLARDLDRDAEPRTLGERLADGLATFGGSWTFLILFSAFLAVWITVNGVVLATRPPDPYPFILLNLMLSCLAAIQAPVIMMSQNRQEAKDRARARNDYMVNLKAELEIRHLHEKVDHLILTQWERLARIQEVQLEVLEELGKR